MHFEWAFFLELELGASNLVTRDYQGYGRGIYGSEI